MEPRNMLMLRIHPKNHLMKELTVPRNCLVVRLVHLFRGEEKGENMLRSMAMNILRNPNHPLLIWRLRRGMKKKLGYLS
jgi:hypothetical protein